MSFTLDDLKRAAESRFADFVIDDGRIVLRNPVNLSKTDRAELSAMLAELGEDVDMGIAEETLTQIFGLVAKTATMKRAILSEVKDNLPLAMIILEKYQEHVGVGEASDSPN